MCRLLKIYLITLFIIIITTGCGKTHEDNSLVFESPITSTKAYYTGRKFNKDFSFDLSSNSKTVIKEVMTDHLIYKVEHKDVVPEVEFHENAISDYFDYLSGNLYRIPVDRYDIRIRDIAYLRIDEYEESMDNVRIITDELEGMSLIGAISEDGEFYQAFRGSLHYGLGRDKELSVFNKVFKYLIFRNFDNQNFEVGDVFIYEIPFFTVDELNPGVKYQDGRFEEFYSNDYVDYNTVIQYY